MEYEVTQNWNSEFPEDLPLKVGDAIVVLDRPEHGWWTGLSKTIPPRKGHFPKIYVRPITEKESAVPSHESIVLRTQTFSLETIEAFDALVNDGFAVEIQDINAATATVEATDSEPVYTTAVTNGSRITLNCVGMIWDGANTETQVFSEGTLSFTVGSHSVPVGLEEGVLGLKLGTKANIISTPLFAYGDVGYAPVIPPNAHIVYGIEILSISTSTEESDKPSEGNIYLLNHGISPRVSATQITSPLAVKARAISLQTADTIKKVSTTTEITDDMLAQAAQGIGLGN